MKPFQINFIEDRRWRKMLGTAGILILCIAAPTGWQLWRQAQSAAQTQAQMRTVQLQLMQLQAKASAAKLPQQDAQAPAKRLLGQDLNKLFGTLEGMTEKGARLLAVDFDAASGTIRLTYELESIDRASVVTAALNGGYDKSPWRLEGVNSVNAGSVPGLNASSVAFRANWSASLDLL